MHVHALRRHPLPLALALLLAAVSVAAEIPRPGETPDGGVLLATSQLLHPAGRSVSYSGGRPLDLALSPDGRTVYVKGDWSLLVLDAAAWTLKQQLGYPTDQGASLHGIAVSRDGAKVYVTLTLTQVAEGLVAADGKVTWGRTLEIAGKGKAWTTHPCGIALAPDGKTAWVALSMHNALVPLDLATGKPGREIPVGIAPYAVALAPDGRSAWVSNWGGRRPKRGERTARSAGADVLVDERGIAASGTVSLVDLVRRRGVAEVATGLHPAGLALSRDGGRLYVACANADAVGVVDAPARTVIATLPVKPDPALPYGSAPNALALSPDGASLYVAVGGNNAVAVVHLGRGAGDASRVLGFVPAGWYPGGVATDGRRLFIANVKGAGSRDPGRKAEEAAKSASAKAGWHVTWVQGTVTRADLPSPEQLTAWTAQVKAGGGTAEILRARERAAAGAKAVPVPLREGEPSVFEHVVYVIKENRTYDQVLGDEPKGNGMKELCVYGRDVTPNQHVLARSFVLLDNYYCNGVLSSDGHAWCLEANVSNYLEKATGGWTRTYDFGTDCLSYSSSGCLWEDALAHGLSFRNYGETANAKLVPDSATFLDALRDFTSGAGKIGFTQRIPIDRLRQYSCPDYPGWDLRLPDVRRADVFLRELKAFEAKGSWPNLILLYLPQNHTSGTEPGAPTPRAMVADNDLALGRVLEGISRSRFWPTTCVFVVEDDPQDGFDHVDGHRSVAQVISPYSRLGKTVSGFYNQTGVLRTIERILGLPPLTQFDGMAPLMTACFTAAADLSPVQALPATIALDEMNPAKASLGPAARRFAAASERLNFDVPDAADEDTLNRIVWFAARGDAAPYPAALAGAHGRGLKALGLALRPAAEDDD